METDAIIKVTNNTVRTAEYSDGFKNPLGATSVSFQKPNDIKPTQIPISALRQILQRLLIIFDPNQVCVFMQILPPVMSFHKNKAE